jgi:ATP-dependent helicase/nuclease subunit A
MSRKDRGGFVPPDQVERDRITDDLARNMLVEAAAGTGKTTSIVERMVALLAGGKCGSIRNLAAVTFTRKAAAELRGRFQIRLERAVRETEGSERERLERALANIEQGFIGTIHSFCARLLRERPVEANVDLAFEEIDEDVDRRLRTEAWDEFAAWLLVEDVDGLQEGLDRLGLRLEDLEDTFMRFADFPDVEEWPVPDEGRNEPDLTDAREELHRYLAHMRRLGPDLPAESGTDSLIRDFKRLPRIISHYGDLGKPSRLVEVLSLFDKNGKLTQKEWMRDGRFSRDDARQEGARWEQFRAGVVQPALCAWHEYCYPSILAIMFRAREVYDHLRAERGLLNFQDLLIKAAGLLREKPHVRRYFCDRFEFLLVDEFQDTDPVQAEVMMLLTATDPKETEWRKCAPRPGSLFVVGDPKQSIYRFRRADIVTYNEVKTMIRRGEGPGKEGIVVRLSTNFRTVGSVIQWVNDVFSPKDGPADDSSAANLRFPREDTDASPAYVSLETGRVGGGKGRLEGTYLLSIPEGCGNTEEAVEYEADFIARTIRHAIDAGISVARTERELAEGKSEGAGPGDFLVVTFRRRHLSLYAHKLQDLGIPHKVSGGSALNEVGELKLLHLCLKAVVSPDDPVALVAVLRSELFGVSDRALYAFRKAGGAFSFREAVPAGLGGDNTEALQDAFERLGRYARWLRRMPDLAAIEKITADLGLMALAGSRPGGDVEVGSLAKAIEILRAAQNETWTSEQIVGHLGQLVNLEATHDGISARSGEGPHVRIMNLHKVKGLEAPVVFLADPSGEHDHGVQLHIDRSADRVLGYMAVYGRKRGYQFPLLAHPDRWEHFQEKERTFVEAETLRLRYVAATRAGSAMIVTQRPSRGLNRKNPWKTFAPYLREETLLPDPGPQRAPAGTRTPLAQAEVNEARSRLEDRLVEAMVPTFDVQPAKKYALASMGQGTPEETGTAPAEGPVSSGLESFEDGEHGVEWGTVIHTLLQVATENPEGDLQGLARTALVEQGLDASLAEMAAETVSAVMKADIWQRAMASRRRFAEVPFEILLEREAAVPVLVRGSIDLVFEESDGWVIVDYKTDSVPGGKPDALVDKYAPQVRLYAQSWERITGEKVKEMGLYFSRANRFERIAF